MKDLEGQPKAENGPNPSLPSPIYPHIPTSSPSGTSAVLPINYDIKHPKKIN